MTITNSPSKTTTVVGTPTTTTTARSKSGQESVGVTWGLFWGVVVMCSVLFGMGM
jgi:hypothetical protein